MIVGDNGIITQAQRAARETANATVASEEQMNALEDELSKYLDGDNNKEEIFLGDLKPGDYIQYDSGTNGKILCRVLYPLDSEYGLQIISNKSVKNVALGKKDDFETSKIAYNNAIETLNNEAEGYINSIYATDARCIGSIPTVENGIFVNKDKGTETTAVLPSEYIRPNGWESHDTGLYNTDENYIIDQEQMEKFNLQRIEENYWLASRNVETDSDHCTYHIRCITSNGNFSITYLCYINSSGSTYGESFDYGLRPCIHLKNDIKITEGNGSEEKPYILE